MTIFRFFCDESYDSDPKKGTGMMFYEPGANKPVHVPQTYVVGGFFSNDITWTEVEERWKAENKRAGVTRYHAANVNARSGEFAGWSKDQQREYSKNLIQILVDQGRYLHAVSCSIWASDYYQIINDHGRKKLGHPYIACFKSCVAMIAREMEVRGFAPEDKFAVILDRNDLENEAVKVFYQMKGEVLWPYRHRLATCASGGWEDFIPLQPADLIAYETFRLIHEKATGPSVRKALQLMFPTNGFIGYGIDVDALNEIKEPLESSFCLDNGFVVHFPSPPPEGKEP